MSVNSLEQHHQASFSGRPLSLLRPLLGRAQHAPICPPEVWTSHFSVLELLLLPLFDVLGHRFIFPILAHWRLQKQKRTDSCHVKIFGARFPRIKVNPTQRPFLKWQNLRVRLKTILISYQRNPNIEMPLDSNLHQNQVAQRSSFSWKRPFKSANKYVKL